MGRKKKFGEESDFVSVRVPKSKRKGHRNAIEHFVEKKFIKKSHFEGKEENKSSTSDNSDGFERFEEFVNKLIEGKEEEKED